MIDPADVRKDMGVGREFEDHDQRVVRAGWTYYVRATRSPQVLTREDTSAAWGLADGVLLGAALSFV